ncbi:MAG: pilus assembly protein [Pseudomonadales bacterium]|nr:pilus assembly protein [Pseudomonadales bacterium]
MKPITITKNKVSGASIIETMLVFPIILFLGFGVVHLGLIFQAQSNLEYAALMAARVGASTSIDIASMQAEVIRRMQASELGVPGSSTPLVNIQVLNPTQGMFDQCGEQPVDDGDCAFVSTCEIPNFGLQLRPRGLNCDGASIQDANLLRIRVNYLYDTKIPFLNRMPFTRGAFAQDSLAGDGVNVFAVATVRMQSPARRTINNTANIVQQ